VCKRGVPPEPPAPVDWQKVLGPRPGRRRTPSEEARAIVARMSGYGLSATEISRLTGYRPSTLYRSFRDELTNGAVRLDLDVLESAYWQSVGGPEKDWRRAEPWSGFGWGSGVGGVRRRRMISRSG
jgi:hypothetical protein